MAKTLPYLVLSLSTFILIACSTQPTPTIPPPTSIITNQISESAAVTAAINSINNGHMRLIGDKPRVVSAKQMPLYAAHTIIRQRVSGPTTTALETQLVWLIVLESDYQVIGPPGANPTPIPIEHGCIFTILDADGSYREGAAGLPCPQ